MHGKLSIFLASPIRTEWFKAGQELLSLSTGTLAQHLNFWGCLPRGLRKNKLSIESRSSPGDRPWPQTLPPQPPVCLLVVKQIRQAYVALLQHKEPPTRLRCPCTAVLIPEYSYNQTTSRLSPHRESHIKDLIPLHLSEKCFRV